MREAMKLEYEILQKYETLQVAFSENELYLKECMLNLQQDSDSITYEALLLLSYFVFRNVKNQTVRQMLADNAQRLMDFVDGFRIENRDEEK